MRHLLLAGVLALTSTTAFAQSQPLDANPEPVTVTFVDAKLEDALGFIARAAGVTIEFDATVTEEMRRAPLSPQPIRMTGITIEEALSILTARNGLTYTVIGPKAVRIAKKA
jgi:type II secretory pathway component GspD/PulD (secretin)